MSAGTYVYCVVAADKRPRLTRVLTAQLTGLIQSS